MKIKTVDLFSYFFASLVFQTIFANLVTLKELPFTFFGPGCNQRKSITSP